MKDSIQQESGERTVSPANLGRSTRGFTLVELLIVIAIGLTVSAIAMMLVRGSLDTVKADEALQIALVQARQVHERAIDERHIYRLTFTAPRTIQTDRIDLSGTLAVPVPVSSIDLPADTSFTVVSGAPTAAPPNGLGAGSNAIDLSVNNAPGITQVYFQPDGRVLDYLNRVANGIVYLARPDDLSSSRAITIFGTTGRMKGWKLSVTGSTASWGQL